MQYVILAAGHVTNFKFRPSFHGDEKSGEHHEHVCIISSINLPLAPSLYFILEPSLFYHWGLGVNHGCLSRVAAMQYVILGGGHVVHFKFRPSCRGMRKVVSTLNRSPLPLVYTYHWHPVVILY